jgi:hypothetical protein
MKLLRILILVAACAGGLGSVPALADRPRDHGQRPPDVGVPLRDADRAFRSREQGRSMPLPQLERRVMPMMGGADYLGPELNGETYRFKFMQNGRVIWVDVDGQGRVIRRSRDR